MTDEAGGYPRAGNTGGSGGRSPRDNTAGSGGSSPRDNTAGSGGLSPRDNTAGTLALAASRRVSQVPKPVRPLTRARWMYWLHRAVEPNRGYRWLAVWLRPGSARGRLFTAAERGVKEQIFGCQMCGQCALPVTGYACPMTCPKQLRNGPCGGVGADGSCEVFPHLRCVWLEAFDRAAACGHGSDLELLQRPIDHREWGNSSWLNYWQGKDDQLWTADAAESPLAEAAPGSESR